ncbi:hypothetical protein SCHPADRAFT_196947 [Schizopora paradoxa]|uniref:Uncharacterized protein n=1 Tax=Schizopora paradoxa TaxID=27342 RepID=A0A0H2RYP4_9AGAM|nr:hypothetical protein SCHPADRAFT_196947 [Schizopora paradoxa]
MAIAMHDALVRSTRKPGPSEALHLVQAQNNENRHAYGPARCARFMRSHIVRTRTSSRSPCQFRSFRKNEKLYLRSRGIAMRYVALRCLAVSGRVPVLAEFMCSCVAPFRSIFFVVVVVVPMDHISFSKHDRSRPSVRLRPTDASHRHQNMRPKDTRIRIHHKAQGRQNITYESMLCLHTKATHVQRRGPSPSPSPCRPGALAHRRSSIRSNQE